MTRSWNTFKKSDRMLALSEIANNAIISLNLISSDLDLEKNDKFQLETNVRNGKDIIQKIIDAANNEKIDADEYILFVKILESFDNPDKAIKILNKAVDEISVILIPRKTDLNNAVKVLNLISSITSIELSKLSRIK